MPPGGTPATPTECESFSTKQLTLKLLTTILLYTALHSGCVVLVNMMKSATGRWVSDDDFFGREDELRVLETRVLDGNHVLLTGQRRMGKTSVVHELGRRLRDKGWIFLFADVEGASCTEDAIADIAKAAHPVRPIALRLVTAMGRRFGGGLEAEVSVHDFRLRVRATLDSGNWRRFGEQLLSECATQDRRVLLVIDELPIFLKRMLRVDKDARRVDEFLSWLRGEIQTLGARSPVLVVSGSIGLGPLVRRLGMADRVNYLFPFRLGPWDRDRSVQCCGRLAESANLEVEAGVAEAIYERLGIGIPHHVQSFFAHLRDVAAMRGRDRVTLADVDEVYRTVLLGPSGQISLTHYETRLADGLDGASYRMAMEILAETATSGVFTPSARRCLERLYAELTDDASAHVADALDVLVHDGYLETGDSGHRFVSHLLGDWWSTRFCGHHVPLESRHLGLS